MGLTADYTKEDRSNELKYRSTDNRQTELQREKRMKRLEQSMGILFSD